jgi:hypothetical protein
VLSFTYRASGADPISECPKIVSTTWAISTMAHELQLLTTVIIGKVALYYNLKDRVRLLIIESLKLAYTEAFINC